MWSTNKLGTTYHKEAGVVDKFRPLSKESASLHIMVSNSEVVPIIIPLNYITSNKLELYIHDFTELILILPKQYQSLQHFAQFEAYKVMLRI